jgi:hypothetical protein
LNNNRRRLDDIRIRSCLAGITTSSTDLEELKRKGWVEQGILVVDTRRAGLSDNEKAFINNMGNKFYGRRNDR